MTSPVLSVCVFCLICATHSPCSSHGAVRHESSHLKHESSSKFYQSPSKLEKPSGNISRVKLKSELPAVSEQPLRNVNEENNSNNPLVQSSEHNLHKRNSITDNNADKQDKSYLKKIFEKFGDGNTMSMEDFDRFIERLDLLQVLSTKLDTIKYSSINNNVPISHNKEKCINNNQVFSDFNQLKSNDTEARINESMLQNVCPEILYNVLVGDCTGENIHVHNHEKNSSNNVNISVWIYSTSAVILTSACGVLALVIIPLMQKKFYKPLLQFLVALAVGTLAGDALLHLLPHAMTHTHSHDPHSDHHQETLTEEESMNSHDENIWKGFVAMCGLTFFFFMEKLILLVAKWRKRRHKEVEEVHSHMKFVSNGLEDLTETNPTQCMDRYNPYPYCYQDILNRQLHGCQLDTEKPSTCVLDDTSDGSFGKLKSTSIDKTEDNQNVGLCAADNNMSSCTEVNKMLPGKTRKNDNITIILREHGSSHHGHSHSHGHVHAAPQNFSSVAWMVIMGDGLHNFTDGMAIGAAFSSSLAGGFSTAVAVFCHEMPHELGDFAMLLKAGMSIRQALFYNLLSSVLSLLGNVVGIYLGNTEYGSSWLFAAAAGMFIYIALVDMIPELSSSHEDESNLTQCSLHLSGLMLGFGIMTMIAMYEEDLKTIFKEST